MISRSYYLGWTTAQIADDLHIAEWFVNARLHFAVRGLQLTLERARPLCTAARDLSAPGPGGAPKKKHSTGSRLTLLCMPDLHLMVELRVGLLGIEPLTYSMRTNVSRRLLRKGVLVAT